MRAWSCALAIAASGCASFNPVLAPSRVLPANTTSAELGSGYNAPLVDTTLSESNAAARQVAQTGVRTAQTDAAITRGALAYGQLPPGVGSYLGARVGLGNGFEGNLGLLGYTLRIGGRRVFWTDADNKWSLALGLQGRFGLLVGAVNGAIPGLNVREGQIYGGDVSAVIGQNNSGIYDVYIGLRAGFTHASGLMSLDGVNAGATFNATHDRIEGAATVGLRVGFGHLAALMEIQAVVGYYWMSSDAGAGLSGNGVAFAVIPAAGVAYTF